MDQQEVQLVFASCFHTNTKNWLSRALGLFNPMGSRQVKKSITYKELELTYFFQQKTYQVT